MSQIEKLALFSLKRGKNEESTAQNFIFIIKYKLLLKY